MQKSLGAKKTMAADTRRKSRLLKWALPAAALLVAIVAALPFLIDADRFRPQVESRLSEALGRRVRMGAIRLSLLSGRLAVEGLEIGEDPAFGTAPFVTARSLKIGVRMRPLLFSRQVRITGITLDRPEIRLIGRPDGSWNFSSLGAGETTGTDETGESAAPDVFVQRLRISDGRVTVIEGEEKPSVYDSVNLAADNLSHAAAFPFTLTAALPGGGDIRLEGTAGPLGREDTLQTPFAAELTARDFDLVASGFVREGSGVSGLLDFSGVASSDGRMIESTGSATAERLQVAPGGRPAGIPVSLDYRLNYDLVVRRGAMEEVRIGIGKAAATLAGSFDARGETPDLNLRLDGAAMPVEELAECLPAFGVALPKGATLKGGTLDANLTAEGPLDAPVIRGTAEMAGTRLEGFDLSGRLAAVARLAGLQPGQHTEIETLSTAFEMTPEGIRVERLLLVVPALGTLSGAGRISPEQALDFAMRAAIEPGGTLGAGLGRLVKGGKLDIPFFVRGSASDPAFVLDPRGARGLLDTVRGGGDGEAGGGGGGRGLEDTVRSIFK
jgi:AsmA protein